MVKNTQGGNKAKKQARKSSRPMDPSMIKARFSDHPDEVYACCSKLLGNGTCAVMCIDGIERLCIIRNKFRGRGKRGNVLTPGVWCLVGRRDFEKPKEGKLEKTDLLEVYGEVEKKLIIQKEIALKDKWKLFNNLGGGLSGAGNDDDEDTLFQQSHDLDFPDFEDEDGEGDESLTQVYEDPSKENEIDINDI